MVFAIDGDQGVLGVFPPEEVARVKAIAYELPRTQGVPLSRFSRAELHRLVVERGVCEARTLNAFERQGNEIAEPFDWNFTRDDLAALITRLTTHEPQLRLAASTTSDL